MSFKLVTLVAAVCAACCGSFAAAQDSHYALLELSLLNRDEPHTWTRAIDAVGNVVGASSTDAVGFHGVRWTSSDLFDLGTLGGIRSEAKGLNSLGEAVGWSSLPGSSDEHAVLWRNGQVIDLGTLGGNESRANAINDLSQVVGVADAVEGGGGFLWENGRMTALPNLGQSGGAAYDINAAGQIVGSSATFDWRQKAVLWENGGVVELPILRSDPSAALAINDLGQIVGQSDGPNDNAHAVAWVNEQIVDLHNSELGIGSSAWGINNVGQVVGWVGRQPTNVYGFVWDQYNGMRTLDSLMPPKPRKNWRIDMAWDINDAGQIAAQGYVIGQPLKAYPFLLTPVAPTMELSSPVPGAAPGPNTLTLTGATPGARVVFLYSLHSGGTRIPGCDLQQNALQLDNPQIIGTAIADGNGEATITRSVPVIARGQTILFQAVVQNECAISQLVVHRFE
ncbi:MAG: hypothetical protein KJZ69_07360 [Phycisphaerales bacterium]|nr:hypothetical protein [Phycisphaerales bacterium]